MHGVMVSNKVIFIITNYILALSRLRVFQCKLRWFTLFGTGWSRIRLWVRAGGRTIILVNMKRMLRSLFIEDQKLYDP